MTLKEVNQLNNKTLASLVNFLPDMTALELSTYKELIARGDYLIDGDDGGDLPLEVASALIGGGCAKLKNKIYMRLK